jgi:hypothetical protein
MSAREILSVSEANFPANGSSRQKLEFALKYAVLAPREIDWQPWKIQMADTYLDLIARDDPALEAIDPDGRELMIGCGAALFYLKLALKHFGCLGRVELFPDLDQPALVARIHAGFSRERDAQEKVLFEAITASCLDALPLGEAPVSITTLAALSHAVAGERGWLEFAQSEISRQRVKEIALTDEQRWMNFDHARARPTSNAPVWQPSRWPRLLFASSGRSADSHRGAVEPARPLSVSTATLAVVKTKTDDNHGWLAAGQTMARAVLQAQVLGLSWGFFNQVRRRAARAALRVGIGHKGFAQVILRFASLATGETVRLAPPATATATFR